MTERYGLEINDGEYEREETIRALEILPEVLGFADTEEMSMLRDELVDAMSRGEDTKERATEYRLLAERVVEECQDEAYGRAQIGLLIHIAIMRRDGGRLDDYREDLEDALMSAYNRGYEDVVMVLDEILAQGL